MVALLDCAFGMNMIHSLSLVPKKDAVPVNFCGSYVTHEETRRKQNIMLIHPT
jgi:hypothetical protein